MSKVLCIGDIHGKMSQFSVFKQFLDWSAEIAIKNRVDFVVNLGDTFHNHAVLRSEILTEFRSHVESIVNSGIPYIYIVGNHDCYKPDDMKYHALQGLVGIDKFTVIDSVQHIDNMTFVPYCYDRANFPSDVKEIVFAHQSFSGSSYGNIVADPNHISTVDPEPLPCELIYSGHIHLRQTIGKVRYPGSPFSWSASDVGQVKGVVIFDTENYQETFYQSPTPMWHKISLYMDKDPGVALSKSLGSKIDHYVIETTGTKASIASFLSSKEFKKAIDGFSVSVKAISTDNDKVIQSITATSIDGIVKEYVERVYRGSIDKQSLLRAAMDIMGVNDL
jgi:DNA repair exonuclease SbcCD nuclease subunit